MISCLKKIAALASSIGYTPTLEIKGKITYTRDCIKIDGKKVPDLSDAEIELNNKQNSQLQFITKISSSEHS